MHVIIFLVFLIFSPSILMSNSVQECGFDKHSTEMKVYEKLVTFYTDHKSKILDFQGTKEYGTLQASIYLLGQIGPDKESQSALKKLRKCLQKNRVEKNNLSTQDEKVNAQAEALIAFDIDDDLVTHDKKSAFYRQLRYGVSKHSTLEEDHKIIMLPEEIGELKNLKGLQLVKSFVQHLPKSIGKLQDLTHLLLENNQLRELPDEIGKLEKLKILILTNNFLRELPESMGDLEKLETFSVNGNSGGLTTLPESLLKLKNLQTIYLDINSPILKTKVAQELIKKGVKIVQKNPLA